LHGFSLFYVCCLFLIVGGVLLAAEGGEAAVARGLDAAGDGAAVERGLDAAGGGAALHELLLLRELQLLLLDIGLLRVLRLDSSIVDLGLTLMLNLLLT
jgi:hypothetical protein